MDHLHGAENRREGGADDPLAAEVAARIAALAGRVEAALARDRSTEFFGYQRSRRLRRIRDQLRTGRFPTTDAERRGLALSLYLTGDAAALGLDWRSRPADLGPLTELFDIDARILNEGRGRDELSPAALAAYLAECDRFAEEHREAMARAHNGEEPG